MERGCSACTSCHSLLCEHCFADWIYRNLYTGRRKTGFYLPHYSLHRLDHTGCLLHSCMDEVGKELIERAELLPSAKAKRQTCTWCIRPFFYFWHPAFKPLPMDPRLTIFFSIRIDLLQRTGVNSFCVAKVHKE